MKIIQAVFCAFLLFYTLAVHAQTTDHESHNDTVLKNSSLAEVTALINANPVEAPEMIFTAMHNNTVHGWDIRDFCLSRIGSLPKLQQARLIARILNEKSIIKTDDELSDGWEGQAQLWLQVPLRRIAYKLLGRTTNADSVMTRSELKSLVTELDAVH